MPVAAAHAHRPRIDDGSPRLRPAGRHPLARPPGVATLGPVGADQAASPASEAPDGLDRWIEDVGEDHIAVVVELTRRGVADGTIVAFSDKESFLQHLASRVDHPR